MIRYVPLDPYDPHFQVILEEDLREAALQNVAQNGVFDINWRGFSFTIGPKHRLIRHASAWTLLGELPPEAQKMLASARDRLRGYSGEVSAWTVAELQQFGDIIHRFLLPQQGEALHEESC